MEKAKYRVGDKVKVLDGSNIENYAGGWLDDMERYVGETMKITSCGCCIVGGVAYRLEGSCYYFDERGLELVEKKTERRNKQWNQH